MLYKSLFLLILFLSSCYPSIFTLKDLPIQHSQLKMNGCYYSKSTFLYPNGVNGLIFFYNTGICINESSVHESLIQAIDFFKSKNFEKRKNYPISKSDWGYYRTIGDSIMLESKEVGQGHPIVKYSGRILNDTTFYINTAKRENKPLLVFENILHHFVKFEPKPDSTNKFLK
jgi:hypothetical protein